MDDYSTLYPPQNPMGQFLNDPGMAMAGSAINNMMQMRRGMAPQSNPFQVLQEQQRRNAILQNQRYQQIEQKKLRDLQMEQAQLGIEKAKDPLYAFNRFVEQRQIQDKPYDEQLAEFSRFQTSATKPSEAPSVIRTMLHMEQMMGRPLTDDERWEVIRGGQTYTLPGGGVAYRAPGGATNTLVTPEAAIEGAAEKAGAETTARGVATAEADAAALSVKNEKAWNVYQAAIQPYSEALDGTSTGPFMGMLPAITSGQQTAEGASAAIAPVLKQLFREAGEGNFTDSDQKILMDMLPKRTDTPAAIEFKFKMIDDIVRAKLGIKFVSDDGTIREK